MHNIVISFLLIAVLMDGFSYPIRITGFYNKNPPTIIEIPQSNEASNPAETVFYPVKVIQANEEEEMQVAPSPTTQINESVEIKKPVEPRIRSIKLSFSGDCTIGDDEKYTWNTFDEVYQKVKDPGYFFRGVEAIFKRDDFTFINFEGTFTHATKKAVKEYRFKGDPSYIKILTDGGIEGVTLANNHSLDYLDSGFSDTVSTLNHAGILWTYFDTYFIKEIHGIKIGFLGYKGWEHEPRSNALLKEHVKALKEQGASFIVANFHWGDQNSYVPNSLQRRMAHSAIDNGVDLVIGHHPHVMQGMEVYKGKNILYSLGNFCFGGAPNPKDKDTIIYQHTLIVDAWTLSILYSDFKIIPARVSSDTSRNNYQPILVTGDEEKRILDKFNGISNQIH